MISNATEFGKIVQKALIDCGISQPELMEAIRRDTGLQIDSSYLHRILTGRRNAPKIVASINKILGLTQPLPKTTKEGNEHMREIVIKLNDNKKVTSVSVDGEVVMKPSEEENVFHEVEFKGYDFEGIDSTLKVVETKDY